MNSRAFFTKALLQAHKQVMDNFLLNRGDPDDEIDIPTADAVAETASHLAELLTIEWELAMRRCQFHDENPEHANREDSTLDLLKPFDASPWIAPEGDPVTSNGKKRRKIQHQFFQPTRRLR
jgi:hypothetical protein